MRRRVNEIVQEVNWWPVASLNGQLKLLFAISDNDFWTTLININHWLRSVSAAWTKKKKFLDNKKTKFISVFSAWIGIIKLCYKFRAVARAEANDSICVCVCLCRRSSLFILSISLDQFPLLLWILISHSTSVEQKKNERTKSIVERAELWGFERRLHVNV